MLEFKKSILEKVSFDLSLFEKELRKAKNWLIPEEIDKLREWCYAKFKGEHRTVLDKLFLN